MQFTNQERAFNKSADSITKTLVKQNAYKTGYNSTLAIVGVSCSKDSFVVSGTLVFQIKCCGESPALRVAANRYKQL